MMPVSVDAGKDFLSTVCSLGCGSSIDAAGRHQGSYALPKIGATCRKHRHAHTARLVISDAGRNTVIV
uniref:hypothetical protein n=1 Tax=Caballeronia sp. AZ7_KS35 TaxID=2921762 RepID=UPI0020283B3D